MTLASAYDLKLAFGTRVLFDDAAITIDEGERVGLVGRNGTGKSSLAKVLAGRVTPDAGEVVHRNGASIEYLEQRPELPADKSARQIVLGGLDKWSKAKAEYDALLERLERGDGDLGDLIERQTEAAAEVERLGGFDRDHDAESMLANLEVSNIDAPVGPMSGGERRRIALARLLVRQPDLAILDEPTNHLDLDTIEWLEQHLAKRYRGAVLLITHDRYLLDAVVSRTVELDDRVLHSYAGGWGAFLEGKAERTANDDRREANRQKFVKREVEWLRRGPKARSTKQQARIDRAEAAIAAKPRAKERTAALELDTTRQGGRVLDLRGLTIELGGRTLVRELELAMVRGERLGIVGPNGCGKTTLLRTITGALTPTAGAISLGKNAEVAYLDQSRSMLNPDETVHENVSGLGTKLTFRDKTVDIRSYLARFAFPPARLREKVSALSGGEKARVALAMLLLRPSNLLLLDEPTNDLDVDTLGALEQMLVESDATAIVVSHDRYFLDRVATGILSFEDDGRVIKYEGAYETFRRGRKKREAPRKETRKETATTKAVQPEAEPSAPAKKDAKLSYKERKELDGLPDAIEKKEAELGAVEAKLADPTLYAERGDEVKPLLEERDSLSAEVERLMTRWEELEART